MSQLSIKNLFVKKITLQAIIILLLAACFYLYEFIMQVALGVIQQDLMYAFVVDATQIGILSGFFYLSYTPFQLFGGLLLDRYSARIILTCVCTTFACGVLLFAHAHNIYVASLARFIMGAGAACAFTTVLHLTARWVPAIHFAFFVGIAEMMGALGAFSGTEPLAILLKHFDWRSTIAGFAYAGFILAILIALIVRNQPKEHQALYAEKTSNSIWTDLKTIMHGQQTWSIGIYSFFIWAPVLAFSALWGVEFIRVSHGFDKVAAARAVNFGWLGMALASPIIGWISDIIKRRCIIMTICALSGTVAITIVLFVTTVQVAILYVLMFVVGFASAGQTLSFALIKDNHSPQTNSAANGFNNMAIVASGLLMQPLVGKLLDIYWQGTIQEGIRIYNVSGYQKALLVLPICYFIATIISIFFIKETHCIAVWRTHKT